MPRAEQVELATQLEQARERIAEITAELEAAHRTPLPLADALKRVHAMVDHAKASMPPLGLESFVHDHLGPGRVDLSLLLVEQPSALLVALAGEQIAQRLEAQLKALYAFPGLRTLPGAERLRLIERLEDQLLDAEVAEEKVVRAMESTGAEPNRRPDAKPAVVLAAL